VIKGITEGCLQAGCSLVGGETAEMPGFYEKGEYDLSGFAVGAVEREKIINGKGIKKGDAVIGIASNGLHSNGFSLVRKVLFDYGKMRINKYLAETRSTLAEELLRPTTIYVKAYNALKDKIKIKGMAHITGGGIPGNLPRIFPKGVQAVINERSWNRQPIFELIKRAGRVPDADMKRTFNMGIGLIIVVDSMQSEKTMDILKKNKYNVYLMGNIEKGSQGVVYA